eukprot:TRINITY_DN2019_c0_g2_i1.p1 TRINITY_DN2019_c0_g2~~TRINITY_DN2019_c0_g2_i1.p1  ORF type:complete len:490 (+),score=102.11 TRINITY_DN2019_c0_g2_i1:116-1585(+)
MCTIQIEEAVEYFLQLVQHSEKTYTLTPKVKSRVVGNEREMTTQAPIRESDEPLERLYTSKYTVDFTTAVITSNIPHHDTIIEQCHAKSSEIPSSKRKWLNCDEIDSIILYTFEYSKQEEKKYSPYKILNQALMVNSIEKLEPLKGFMWLLFSGLHKLPRVFSEQLPSKRFYRGITIPVDYSAFKSEKDITFYGFTSTSTEVDVTLHFMKEQQSGFFGGTLFHICDAWGYNLQDFSLFNKELEVLLEPGSSFKVLSLMTKASPVIVELSMKPNIPLALSSILDCWSNVDNWECTLSEMNAVVGRIGSLKPIYQEKLFLSLVTDEKLMSDLERLQVDSLEKLLSFFKEQCIMKQSQTSCDFKHLRDLIIKVINNKLLTVKIDALFILKILSTFTNYRSGSVCETLFEYSKVTTQEKEAEIIMETLNNLVDVLPDLTNENFLLGKQFPYNLCIQQNLCYIVWNKVNTSTSLKGLFSFFQEIIPSNLKYFNG